LSIKSPEILEEIEYQHFLKRNLALASQQTQEDDTLLDGLDDIDILTTQEIESIENILYNLLGCSNKE